MKLNRILIAFLAGAAVLAGCQPIEKVTLNLADSTAPVMTSFDVDSEAITVSYSPAVLYTGSDQVNPQLVYHNLAVVKVIDGSSQREVSAKVESEENKDEKIIVAKLNAVTNALLGLGYSYGDQVDLELVVRAQLSSAATNGFLDSQAKATINGFVLEKPVPGGKPKIPDIDLSQYEDLEVMKGADTWGIIGPAVLDWNTDVDLQKISDDPEVWYAASVPFAADKFKFRGNDTWGDYDLGGGEFAVDAPIVMSKGGSDMAAVAGSYDVFLFPVKGVAYLTAGTGVSLPDIDLTQYEFMDVMVGADTWGIIGPAVSDWSTDVDLEKISDDPEIWAAMGVPFQADKFKFRGNDEWGDYDLGGGEYALDTPIVMSKGGGDMKMDEAGSYDVFLYPTYGVAYLRTGSGEGPTPPSKPAVWSLIGTIGGTNWDTDYDLANTTGDIWIIRNVAIGADDLFKIRADHDWGKNVGGPGDADEYVPEIGVAFEAGEKNIKIGVAGNYDVTFDFAANTILIETHVAVYSLIGSVNGSTWNVDVVMTENEGVWTSPVVAIAGAFKIRYDYSWDDANTYGAEAGFVPTVGEPFTAVQPGSDIQVAEGNYKVQFTPATKEVLITAVNYPEKLYMIGEEFGNWKWESDDVVEMTPVLHNPEWGAEAEGQFWTVRYFSAGKGFKFCAQRAWNGDFWGLTENDGFIESDGNCTVTADGFYLVHIDFKNEKVHVEPARVYGIGQAFGAWDEEMESARFQEKGKTLVATTTGAGALRMYVASTIATSGWWTREFNVIDGKIVPRLMEELSAPNVLASQVVTLDFNAGTGSITGEGEAPALPEKMYMIGEALGGWDWGGDYIVDMTPVNSKPGHFWAIRYIEAGKGFKFAPVKEWGQDFTNLGEDTGYTVDGGNCFVAENGVYMFYVDAENKKVCVEKAKVYGMGNCFGGWDEGMESALFTESDGKLVGTTSAEGELRLYAASSIASSAWWTREFLFFDGKIAYRGNGGDQERVTVGAGKKIVLDFNAGTGKIEDEGGQGGGDVQITIDGNMSEWASIEGVSSTEGPYYEFKAYNDGTNLYLYSKRNWHDGLWKDAWGGYFDYGLDKDRNKETGGSRDDVTGLEIWMYLYLFTGTADAPTFAAKPAGAGYPDDKVFSHVAAAGTTDKATSIETEVSLPLADLGLAKGDVVDLYTWGNKSAINLKETPLTYTVK